MSFEPNTHLTNAVCTNTGIRISISMHEDARYTIILAFAMVGSRSRRKGDLPIEEVLQELIHLRLLDFDLRGLGIESLLSL